jgi:hypothetical protein
VLGYVQLQLNLVFEFITNDLDILTHRSACEVMCQFRLSIEVKSILLEIPNPSLLRLFRRFSLRRHGIVPARKLGAKGQRTRIR